MGYEETLIVQPGSPENRASTTFSIVKSDRTARREFDRVHRGSRDRLAAPASDELTVTAIVGGRQRLKVFGKYSSPRQGSPAIGVPFADISGSF